MDRIGLLAFLARHRRAFILVGLMSTFAGADLALNRPKGSELHWLAIPFLTFGAALLAWSLWPFNLASTEVHSSLAGRLVHFLSWHGRLRPYFPILGVAIAAADITYNATLSATPALLTEDTIILLSAAVLIGYNFLPPRFARERTFVLTFFIAMDLILVLPLLFARAFYSDFGRSVDVYSWVALAPQTSLVLALLGVANSVHVVPGATAPGLTFTPQHLAGDVTVVITTACSGIYSFGIFASAFVAFVLTEYSRPSGRLWIFLALGLVTAYVANVLRMVVIVLVGYYTDTAQTDLQNMLAAHSYAGWIIFLGWIALFWSFLLRFMPGRGGVSPLSPSLPHRAEVRCLVCGNALSLTISAIRCSCGLCYHRRCLVKGARCNSCGQILDRSADPPAVRTGSGEEQ